MDCCQIFALGKGQCDEKNEYYLSRSLRDCLFIFSKTLLVFFLCGYVIISGGQYSGKSYLMLLLEQIVMDINTLVSKWNTRKEKKWVCSKITISYITLQEPVRTVPVLTSIMLFPVMKCYSLFKCLSNLSTIQCTQLFWVIRKCHGVNSAVPLYMTSWKENLDRQRNKICGH